MAVFDKARATFRALNVLMEHDPYYATLFLLATEDVLTAHGGEPLTLDNPQQHEACAYLRAHLRQTGLSPFDRLVEWVRLTQPEMAYVYGIFLPQHLRTFILDTLREALHGAPRTPAPLEVEHLSPTNPIRIHAYTEEMVYLAIPRQDFMDSTIGAHYLELAAYGQSLRPVRHPGRPRKAPEAPRTPHRTRRLDPALAQQAWDLKRQGVRWPDIARALYSDRPVPTDPKAREALRQHVRRLCDKGYLEAGR
jgi:hypothetical protein